MTWVVCTFSTPRCVGLGVGWLHSSGDPRTTLLAPREVWAEQVVCDMNKLPVLILFSRLVGHEVSGGCARWRLGCFVFVNQQNAGYESQCSYLPSWTKISPELEYIYPFTPPTPRFAFPPILYTPPPSWAILISCDMHKTIPLIVKHTREPTHLWILTLGFYQIHATVSYC